MINVVVHSPARGTLAAVTGPGPLPIAAEDLILAAVRDWLREAAAETGATRLLELRLDS